MWGKKYSKWWLNKESSAVVEVVEIKNRANREEDLATREENRASIKKDRASIKILQKNWANAENITLGVKLTIAFQGYK